MSTRTGRGRRILSRLRRGELEDDPREPEAAARGSGQGWDHTVSVDAAAPPATSRSDLPLRARLLAILADPRIESLTAEGAGRLLGVPRQDAEASLESMARAGELVAMGEGSRAYAVSDEQKARLESMFRDAAQELGEHGMLMRVSQDDALVTLDDDAEEPRLPVTAGLLSLFLPGTGQLLNGDVGRASLVFAVWSLAWITHLSPVWTFVCLYAGAEAFFTAKIRSMERKLAREATRNAGPATPPALPPSPSKS